MCACESRDRVSRSLRFIVAHVSSEEEKEKFFGRQRKRGQERVDGVREKRESAVGVVYDLVGKWIDSRRPFAT